MPDYKIRYAGPGNHWRLCGLPGFKSWPRANGPYEWVWFLKTALEAGHVSITDI